MSNLLLLLGNKNLSSWSLRPWLLLRQAGIAFEERVFLFEEDGWRDEIVKLSPSRKVPTLRDNDDETVIWDSLAICEYVNDRHPEKHLWPSDIKARAFARAVSAEMHSSFGNLRSDLSMDVTARIPRRKRSIETQSDIDRIVRIWSECRSKFGGGGGDFLFGSFSIADAMFAPIVWRFRSYDVPVADPLARAWYEMMLALPAMKEWEADAEREVATAKAKSKSDKTTPDPKSAQHCFAVIFSGHQKPTAKSAGYDETANAMEELAKKQPGYLGIESARNPDGFGITVSYWDSLEAITQWKSQAEHLRAQARGREEFYARYEVRVCSVERGYKFPR